MKTLLKISTVVILSLILQTCRKSSLPKLTTENVLEITQTTATSGGNVTDNGGDDVTGRGICWSTDSLPTVNSSKTSDGSGNGPFTSKLTGLNANTTYHVRAYAINGEGVGYGDNIRFITSPVPTAVITTNVISAITSATALSGGNITSDGGSAVTARGVCWNTSTNPTIANNFTTDGTGSGNFASNLKNLLPATIYYVRAYATNSAGTVYANELSFTTLCSVTAPGIGTTTQPSCTTATGSVVLNGLPATGTWTLTRTPGGTTTTGTGTSTTITGLAGGTYTFTVTNSSGCSSEASLNVTINELALPSAVTNVASSVTSSSAILNGSANGNGSQSVVTFEYGTTTSYGSEIPADQSPVTNGAITVSRTVTNLSMHTLYHYRVKIVSCAGTVHGLDQEFTTLLPFTTSGLVAYYPFNGNANDESGNGNNGTLLGGATITSDKKGVANKACSVNPGFVQVADNSSLKLSSYTLSIWFKAEQVNDSYNCLIGKNFVTSYAVGFDFGGSLDCPAPTGFQRPARAYVANDGYFFNTSNIACGTWYHMAVTYDNATGHLILYLNGILVEDAILTPGTMGSSSDPLGIGKDGFFGAKFTGIVDEVSIFNRALTQAEITQLFSYY